MFLARCHALPRTHRCCLCFVWCGVVRLGVRKTPACVDSKRLRVCVQASVCARKTRACAENLEEDEIDPPIHTEYFHAGEANTLIFIVDETISSVPSSFSQEPLGTWSCHLTARHGVQLFADVSVTLHVAQERSVSSTIALRAPTVIGALTTVVEYTSPALGGTFYSNR